MNIGDLLYNREGQLVELVGTLAEDVKENLVVKVVENYQEIDGNPYITYGGLLLEDALFTKQQVLTYLTNTLNTIETNIATAESNIEKANNSLNQNRLELEKLNRRKKRLTSIKNEIVS